MKVGILSKEVIKPSSITPTHLRNFKLSLLDQFYAPIYGSLLYFYSSNDPDHEQVCSSHNLKKSLSETLTLFYPLAGKTVDNIMIDCNDNGALFVEARVDIPMSGFLQKPDGFDLKQFLPTKIEHSEETTGFFTLVQASFFSCGSVAIGICFSHKLVDAITAGMFMKSWAANVTGNKVTVPVYEAAALFPPKDIFSNKEHIETNFSDEMYPIRRLVFDSSKIASLKANFGEGEDTPSRSELVTAIIWKSALKAARSHSRSSGHSVMSRVVNLRRKFSPPLIGNSVGNFLGFQNTVIEGSQVDLRGLIREMRKGLKVFDESYVKMLQSEAVVHYFDAMVREMMKDDKGEAYVCTSLCNMSLYDVDFGWGRPVWVTVPVPNSKNVIWLMDCNRGDGSVEAWVVLDAKDMYLFERDPELLAYASLNPSVQPLKLKSSM